MPLFFLIAIGAGAISLGAATADVAEDGHLGQTKQFAYSQPVEPQPQQALMGPAFDASVYPTMTDCLNAAGGRGVPAAACQR